MRTTLNIDPELLEEVMAITGERSKGRAVERAMEEFVRQDAVERLLALRGKLDLRSQDEWHETDLQLEIEETKKRRW